MLKKLKLWWFNFTHIQCDYCSETCEQWYEAWLFEVEDYKGEVICIKCINNLPNQKNIVYCNRD